MCEFDSVLGLSPCVSEYVCIYDCLFLSPFSSASVRVCLFLILSVSVGI